MAKTPSIAETVERLLQDADAAPAMKVAQAAAPAEVDPRSPLRKLAEKIRNFEDPKLSYDVLHVVKTAMLDGSFGPLPAPELTPETGDKVVSGLRKIANALRLDDHADHERLLAKGADCLRATRGLMLLRELVRE
jgi:hypothetical protein